ncbi:hypothetical protein [Streptomyces aureoversilis]|uniref:Uncharacterized protein n=1 Tax=Streptomyces aureoversilis TaxID=67277 RepID=A0ABV9ZRD5_9ACTN
MDMRRAAFTVTANGSYAARLALDGGTGGWFPERWTLDGPEPYAVPLPGSQPEEPDSEVQPLADGRVLIRRRVAERHTLSLLYPTGPGTGELAVGAVECARLTLLPPAPGGAAVYGLVHDERTTALWRLHGGSFGPERVVEVQGRCAGGAWLDRTGRLLALDRELDGRTKTVVVDLERGGETSPLLQITEESNDRLLLADPYSGLLLVRSDAPGQDRLGWGVLGSARPVRFPECLRPTGAALTPFAAQPGQELTPEGCAVAFRVEGATGSWVGVWRPAGKQLQQFPAPAGWLVGAGLWTSGGELRLPFVTPYVRCGLARLRLPEGERGETRDTGGRGAARDAAPGGPRTAPGQAPRPPLEQVQQPLPPHMPPSGPQLRNGPAAAPPAAPVPQRTQQPPLREASRPAEPAPVAPSRQPQPQPPLQEARPAPESGFAGGPQVQAPSPHEVPRASGPQAPAAPQPVRPVPESGAEAGPQLQVPLLHEVPRPAEPSAPLLQEVRPTGPEPAGSAAESGYAAGPQRQAPLLHEVPRAVAPQTPLLQDAPRPAGQSASAASQQPQPVRPAPESGFAAGPQVPLLHEVPRAAAPQTPLLQDAPRPAQQPQPLLQEVRPAGPEPVRSVAASGFVGGPQRQAPLLHEVPRPAESAVSASPSAPRGLLQEVRSPGPEPAGSAAESGFAAGPQVQAPLLQDAPRPAQQPQPLLQEVRSPGPEPVRAVPESGIAAGAQRQVPLLQEVPPPGPQPARPAPEEQAPAGRQPQPLLQQVPCPPQASPPLVERPHEGPPSCPPQASPQGERAESPASVWTAVPPTGLPGAGMPGAWSVAASGGAPSRPVPLQQAPLGREPRP